MHPPRVSSNTLCVLLKVVGTFRAHSKDVDTITSNPYYELRLRRGPGILPRSSSLLAVFVLDLRPHSGPNPGRGWTSASESWDAYNYSRTRTDQDLPRRFRPWWCLWARCYGVNRFKVDDPGPWLSCRLVCPYFIELGLFPRLIDRTIWRPGKEYQTGRAFLFIPLELGLRASVY